MNGDTPAVTFVKPPYCIGLQRISSSYSAAMDSSNGLHWALRSCSMHGGYVCKRPKLTSRQSLVQNQTMVGSEGRISSPDFPNAYPPNLDYFVKISGPERSRLVVQFQQIDLEFQEECLYDFVSVRDYSETQNHIRWDPGTSPFPLAMLREPSPDDGWSVGDVEQWRQNRVQRSVTKSKDSVEHSLMGLARGISMRRSRKKRYMMSYVRGRHLNRETPSFQPYVRWCGDLTGNMSRFDFVSTGNQALLHFHSDYIGGSSGFTASWTAVDVTGCPQQTITAREGVLQSPNHPYFLINNLDCTYIIQAPRGRRVWIEFTDFEVREDSQVLVDLGDGQGPLRPFADEQLRSDGVYLSSAEKFRITLQTGAHPEGRGFKLVYKTVGTVFILFFSARFLCKLNPEAFIQFNLIIL